MVPLERDPGAPRATSSVQQMARRARAALRRRTPLPSPSLSARFLLPRFFSPSSLLRGYGLLLSRFRRRRPLLPPPLLISATSLKRSSSRCTRAPRRWGGGRWAGGGEEGRKERRGRSRNAGTTVGVTPTPPPSLPPSLPHRGAGCCYARDVCARARARATVCGRACSEISQERFVLCLVISFLIPPLPPPR